jgi:2-(1,2-epoxy-1,2-dihydrophenyl)acetyl-CoA isomerase
VTVSVSVDAANGFAIVSLDRPSRLNALDLETTTELTAALEQLAQAPNVSVVILTGRGKAFCAGGDLAWVSQAGDDRAMAIARLADQFHHAITEICEMRKPVIAAVNGVAAGGGFSLALACDFRVLSQEATVRHAYGSAGLSMDGGSSLTLPRIVGYARALEIATFDAPIRADRAIALGLATEIVDGDALDGAVAMARRLYERALASFGASKRLLTSSYRSGLEEQLHRERDAIAESVGSAEGREGVNAFLEKRHPDFAAARPRYKNLNNL